LQAREGELSLGGARKPSGEDEEYELEARPSGSHDEDAETLSQTNLSERRTSEPVFPPPYLPPPPSAVVRTRAPSNT